MSGSALGRLVLTLLIAPFDQIQFCLTIPTWPLFRENRQPLERAGLRERFVQVF
jgi:hypothetical protein